jgi:hypothetical protein
MIKDSADVVGGNAYPKKPTLTWHFSVKMRGCSLGGFKGICMGCSPHQFAKR